MSIYKTVLITGAAGFLGRYIARAMRVAGWRVVGVGRGVQAIQAELDRAYELTLPDPEFEQAIREISPALYVHAAGPASVLGSIEAPARDFEGATLPWLQALEGLRRFAPDCRCILLSSAAVYGQPLAMPITEETPVSPLSPYGFHRHYCELMLDEYRRLYGMKGTVLRIFSAYGVGLFRQVVWDICRKALDCGGELVLSGTGEETRDFIHAQDVAQAVALLSALPEWQAVYNLASGEEVSIQSLAEHILAQLPAPPALRFDGQAAVGMPVRWKASIERLRGIGFAPAYSMQAGVSGVLTACLQENAKS